MIKIKNSRTTKYLNIKKAILTGFCVLMTVFSSGCKENKEIEITSNKDIREEKQGVEETIIEESQEIEEVGIEKNKEEYQAKDIAGIRVYNPEKGKDEYYFFTSGLSRLDSDEYIKEYFKETELEQYLDSDNIEMLNYRIEYVSVLDDNAVFFIESSHVNYKDIENEYILCGWVNRYKLKVGDSFFTFRNFKVYDDQEVYNNYNYSLCIIGEEAYVDNESISTYGPNYFTLESLGYEANEIVTTKELKEIQENGFQNEKVNETQLKR